MMKDLQKRILDYQELQKCALTAIDDYCKEENLPVNGGGIKLLAITLDGITFIRCFGDISTQVHKIDLFRLEKQVKHLNGWSYSADY